MVGGGGRWAMPVYSASPPLYEQGPRQGQGPGPGPLN